MTLPTYYTVAEVAEAYKVTPWWVKKQVRLGLVTPVRLSGADNAEMRFTAADLEQLERLLRPAPTPAPTRRKRRT